MAIFRVTQNCMDGEHDECLLMVDSETDCECPCHKNTESMGQAIALGQTEAIWPIAFEAGQRSRDARKQDLGK